MIARAAATAALALLATSSFAIPTTFEFGAAGSGALIDPNGMGNDNVLYLATVGEYTLTVTGYRAADLDPVGSDVSDQFFDREEVTRDPWGPDQGLGVMSDTWNDPNVMDGLHEIEALRFDFTAGGTLTQIVFNDWDSNDDFDLAVDGIATLDEMRPAYGLWNGAIAFDTWFAIGADNDNDDFRVRSITVRFDAPTVSTIPLPGTLALIGAGLAGFVARRR